MGKAVNRRRGLVRRAGMVTQLAPAGFDLDRFVADDYASVVAAVGLITGDRASAEDSVQDVLVQLLTRPPAEPIVRPAAWVTVAAANRSRSALRRKGAESRALTRLGGRAESANPLGADPSLSLDARGVLDAIGALPDQQRQVCVMHYYLDESVAGIAEALGVTDGTVKTQLHRARRSLAVALGETDLDDETTEGDRRG